MAHQEDIDSPPARAESRSSTDQVLSMLAKLEQQLEQLGSVQRQHDERLSSLSQDNKGQTKPAPAHASPPVKKAPAKKPPAKKPASAQQPARPKPRGGGAAWWQQHINMDDQPVIAPVKPSEPETPEAPLQPKPSRVSKPSTPEPEAAEVNEPGVSGEDLEAMQGQIAALRTQLEPRRSTPQRFGPGRMS